MQGKMRPTTNRILLPPPPHTPHTPLASPYQSIEWKYSTTYDSKLVNISPYRNNNLFVSLLLFILLLPRCQPKAHDKTFPLLIKSHNLALIIFDSIETIHPSIRIFHQNNQREYKEEENKYENQYSVSKC